MLPQIETVDTAARTALFALLDVPVFDPSAPDGEVPAAKLRAWWMAHRSETRARRQASVLADDGQDPTAWLVAAERLFGDSRLPHLFDSPAPIGSGLRLPPPEVRTGKLTDLLALRSEAFRKPRPGYSLGYGVHKAARLGAMLTLLDRPRGLSVLRELTSEAGDLLLSHPGEYQASEVVGSGFAFRADHGDVGAWSEYRDWLRRERAQPLRGFWVFQQFRALVERPKEPALRGAAEEMFGPDSPWRPLAMAKAGRRPEEMLFSPLLNMREVQRGVLELLRDRTECATLTVGEKSALLRRDDRTEGLNYALPWPGMPLSGTVLRVRYADFLADRLQSLRNMPAFKIWWPSSLRDRALDEMIKVVDQGGEIYQFPLRKRPR